MKRFLAEVAQSDEVCKGPSGSLRSRAWQVASGEACSAPEGNADAGRWGSRGSAGCGASAEVGRAPAVQEGWCCPRPRIRPLAPFSAASCLIPGLAHWVCSELPRITMGLRHQGRIDKGWVGSRGRSRLGDPAGFYRAGGN